MGIQPDVIWFRVVLKCAATIARTSLPLRNSFAGATWSISALLKIVQGLSFLSLSDVQNRICGLSLGFRERRCRSKRAKLSWNGNVPRKICCLIVFTILRGWCYTCAVKTPPLHSVQCSNSTVSPSLHNVVHNYCRSQRKNASHYAFFSLRLNEAILPISNRNWSRGKHKGLTCMGGQCLRHSRSGSSKEVHAVQFAPEWGVMECRVMECPTGCKRCCLCCGTFRVLKCLFLTLSL